VAVLRIRRSNSTCSCFRSEGASNCEGASSISSSMRKPTHLLNLHLQGRLAERRALLTSTSGPFTPPSSSFKFLTSESPKFQWICFLRKFTTNSLFFMQVSFFLCRSMHDSLGYIPWFLLLSCLLPKPGPRHGKEGFQPWSLDFCAPKTIGGTLRTKSRIFACITPLNTSSGGRPSLWTQTEPYPA